MIYGQTGMWTSQSFYTVPPHSCCFRECRRQIRVLSQWSKACAHVCWASLSLRLLQKGQEAAAHTDTSSLSSLLVISPAAQFIFPNTAAEDRRTAGAWLGSRGETRGIEEWRKKEKRGGGSEDSFVRLSSCIVVLLWTGWPSKSFHS